MKKLITFEGTEGSGKSTQAKLLADYLESSGTRVALTREPGWGKLGGGIRNAILNRRDIDIEPFAELCLFCADRAQHVRDFILPRLMEGFTVICDRYYDSTFVYQCFGRGIDRDIVSRMALASSLGVDPDITFLLRMPVEEALDRLRGRGENSKIDEEPLLFHKRIYEGYGELLKKERSRMKVVDATFSPEEVHLEIRSFFT